MRGHVSTPFTLPHGQTVTILRSTKDRHGDRVGAEADHTIAGCGVDWNATTSNREFQDVQITDADLYVPRAADVVASDKVEIGSRTFHVLGKPMWDQVHPMTGTDYGYKLVRLREVAGA